MKFYSWLSTRLRRPVLPTSELYGLFPRYQHLPSCSVRMGDAFRVGGALVAVRCSEPSGWEGPVHALIDDDIEAIIRDSTIPPEYRRRLERAWRSSEILANLDGIQSVAVPSVHLEKLYTALGKKVVRLDPSWPVPSVRKRRVRSVSRDVAFLGTGSHLQDLELLRNALTDSRRNWKFHHFLGKNAPEWLRGLSGIQAHAALNWQHYRKGISGHGFDLCVYPAFDTEVNAARSCNKIMEHAMTGAAALYSATVPFTEKVAEISPGLLVREGEWREAITIHLNDIERLEDLAERSHAHALRLAQQADLAQRKHWESIAK